MNIRSLIGLTEPSSSGRGRAYIPVHTYPVEEANTKDVGVWREENVVIVGWGRVVRRPMGMGISSSSQPTGRKGGAFFQLPRVLS